MMADVIRDRDGTILSADPIKVHIRRADDSVRYNRLYDEGWNILLFDGPVGGFVTRDDMARDGCAICPGWLTPKEWAARSCRDRSEQTMWTYQSRHLPPLAVAEVFARTAFPVICELDRTTFATTWSGAVCTGTFQIIDGARTYRLTGDGAGNWTVEPEIGP